MTYDKGTPTERVVAKRRGVQRQVSSAERRKTNGHHSAMQAGARLYPAPPFPAQHQPKPGFEAILDPQPLYDAPYWKGSGKLDREGGAHHRRRQRHRPGGGGALRTRRRRYRHRLSRGGSGRGIDARVGRRRGPQGHPDPWGRLGAERVPRCRRAHGGGPWSPRYPGQQRGLPGAHGGFRGSHAGALRRDAQDQPLRLFPHGAGRGRRDAAGLARSSTPARSPASRGRSRSSTTPPPRAGSTPSPERSRGAWCRRASG